MLKNITIVLIACSSLIAPALAQGDGRFATIARNIGATSEHFIVEENLMLPMRDGIHLSTSVIRPRDAKKAPTLLLRTPYDLAAELEGKSIYPLLLKNGYALVFQNERGTSWSEGRFQLLAGARNDGYDTLSWIAEQSWSNARIGTYGCSSSAENQLALGAMQHPAHRAMISMSAAAGIGAIPGLHSQGGFYKNGVPLLEGWIGWFAYYGHTLRPKLPTDISNEERNRLAKFYSAVPDLVISAGFEKNKEFQTALAEAAETLPSVDILKRVGAPSSDYERLMTLTPASQEWGEFDYISAKDTGAVPTLHINAWGDFGAHESLELFEFQSDHKDQYLIMAPTAHCGMTKATENTIIGERLVGDGRLDYDTLFLKWLNQNLKMRRNEFKNVPKAQVFLMGGNRWLTSDVWPLKEINITKYFLRSGGKANSLHGDGALSIEAPTLNEQPDHYMSDPHNPVPSKGGGCCGKNAFRDQRDIEIRNDVLVYSTPVLTEGVAVVGELKLNLFVSTSAKGGDIAIKLIDVYPDGTAYNVQETMYRLRYRDGYDAPNATVPGKIYEIEIPGVVTSNYFGPGHQLRIEIAGSNFPNYERNLNTGGANYNETEGVISKTYIYHDTDHPSYISVPVYNGRQIADLK